MSDQYNLYSLLKKYRIRIPVYQRDYAQGRETATNIREHLLDDIRDNLTKEQPTYDLNFVYGSSNKEIFYPVDGQQRLTSLYLIGWYLENCYDKIHEEDPVPREMPHERLSGLNEFSYMTRDSAIDFFHFLGQKEAKKLFDALWEGKCSVPEVFNCHWFKEMWQSDPTVLSAVRFLITVALKYKAGNAWLLETIYQNFDKLTFTLLVSEDEKAEENAAKIYIRMNNRGKELTEFENLKAILDRICEKFQAGGYCSDNKSFVENYNLLYENRLYERIPEMDMAQTPRTLEERTRRMDAITFRYLLLIYCIAYHKSVNSGYECKQLTEELYDISMLTKDGTETASSLKAGRFIRLMDFFFRYVCFGESEQTLATWGMGNQEDLVCLQSSEVAKILYMDAMGDKLTHAELSDFARVLKWISFDHFTFVGDFYDVVEGWIRSIANKGSVSAYFQKMTSADIPKDILVANGWNVDIACKMECLRCISADYFCAKPAKPVIDNYDGKKEWLPFLLYASDFWGTDHYDPKTFQEYEMIYNAFTKRNAPMEIGGLWRAWYAFCVISGASSQGISEQKVILANRHLWCNNGVILDRIIRWNEQYPPMSQLLTEAQKAYKRLYGDLKNAGNAMPWTEQWMESEIRQILRGSIQTNTWLSYLVINQNGKEELLLKHTVEFDKNNRLIFSENKECSVVVMNTLMKSSRPEVKGACEEDFLHQNQEFGMFKEDRFYNWGARTTVSAESAIVKFSFDGDKTYAHSTGNAALVHHNIISMPMKLKSTIKITIDKNIFSASTMGTIFCMNWRKDPNGAFLYLVAGSDDYRQPDLYLWTIDVSGIANGISSKINAKEKSFALIKRNFDGSNFDNALEIEMNNACSDPSNPREMLQFNRSHFSWTCNEVYTFDAQTLPKMVVQTGQTPTKIKL